jgi:translin
MKTKKFEESMNQIKLKLEEEDKARDEVIQMQRKAIRICSEAIKSIHRKEFDKADKKIKEVQGMMKIILKKVEGTKTLECWRGLDDIAQELGEAIFISSIVRNDDIPSVEECKINFVSYMLAASDTIGELRRYMLDSLRIQDFDNAQRAFDYMEFLYSELMTVDYTKMLVGPLRSKLDVARNLVNRSRTDLLSALQAHELKESMIDLSEKLDKYKNIKK